MDQDKKEPGFSTMGVDKPATQGQGSRSAMAADKPSGGTSVGSSTTFGSGASGGTGETATAGDKPRGNGNGHAHRELGAEASRMAQEGIETTRGMAGQLLGDVRHAAEEMLEERKGRAAETVHGVAEALRRTASNLKSENDLMARYAEQAADTVARFSDTVRERRLTDVVADIDDFARRQPTLFLIGAVAAGFIVGRFMASSAERRHEDAFAEDEDLHAARSRRGVRRSAGNGNFTGRGNA